VGVAYTITLELLSVGIAPSHHRPPFGDAQLRLPQHEAVFAESHETYLGIGLPVFIRDGAASGWSIASHSELARAAYAHEVQWQHWWP
jgi:hypothetical protein